MDFSGHPILITFGEQRDAESLLGLRPRPYGTGLEVGAADLGDVMGQFADAGNPRFWLVAIGAVGAIVGLGVEEVVALDPAGFVDQDVRAFPAPPNPLFRIAAKRASRGWRSTR